MAIQIAQDEAADKVLSEDPFALLMGMLLDQQFPMERAFAGPAKVLERFGSLDPAEIAAADPDEFAALCSTPPAVHRFPGSMATRIQALAAHVVAEYDGRTENVAKGGYVLLDVEGGAPDVILIGTGSEVQLAVEARTQLAEKGVRARVVSMPCREWFDAQEQSYRDTVLPPIVKARVSVEAGVAQGWREVVGEAGRIVSLEHFGASADYARIFKEFGITAEAVVLAAEESMQVANG